jgi:hypothetical protein
MKKYKNMSLRKIIKEHNFGRERPVVKLMGQCTEINADLQNPETRGPGK